jgi:hypothetical protein
MNLAGGPPVKDQAAPLGCRLRSVSRTTAFNLEDAGGEGIPRGRRFRNLAPVPLGKGVGGGVFVVLSGS